MFYRLLDVYVHFVLQFLKLYLVSASQLFKELYFRLLSRLVKDSPSDGYNASRSVAVISGGLHGIGYETTKQLMARGVSVIVGSPTVDLGRVADLSAQFPRTKITWLRLDLRSMKSVENFAQQVRDSVSSIDILICNAGVMFVPYQETEDGFETHMSVNYLGHCLLTCLLMPKFRREARIVNVTSCVHKATTINFADLHGRQAYSRYHGYCQSKRAQVLWSAALSRRLRNTAMVLSVHPGVVDSSLYREVWWAPLVSGIVFKAEDEGAAAVVHAALSPRLADASGAYIEDGQIKSRVQDAEEDSLWTATWDMLRPWASPNVIETVG